MENEIIRVGQIGIRFLLESADTNGSVAMFEFTVPVGARIHRKAEACTSETRACCRHAVVKLRETEMNLPQTIASRTELKR